MSKIKSFSKAVVRTTAYSYDSILEILENPKSDWLQNLLKDDYFITSLSLASPELLAEALRIHELDKINSDYQKIEQSILKYATRMATRCTPFGLFSGVGIVPITEKENGIQIGTKEEHYQHFRLDMNFSVQLVTEINKNEALRENAIYYPNTTIYPLGEAYRLVTYSIFNKARSYDLISVERNEYLDRIKAMAESGAQLKELIAFLVSEEIEEEEAKEYLKDLIDSQILISELEPTTIGLEVEIELLRKITRIRERVLNQEHIVWFDQVIKYLKKVIDGLRKLNSSKLEQDTYNHLVQYIIDELPVKIESIDNKFLIQCNIAADLSENSSLSHEQEKIVYQAIDVLGHFQSKYKSDKDSALGKFKEVFKQRYDDRFVPLVDALDVEVGIGYGARQETDDVDFSPFVGGIPVKTESQEETSLSWNHKFHSFWLKKFMDANYNKTFTVEMSDKDLANFEKRETKFSSTFIAKTSFFKDHEEDLLCFEFYGGSTATLWHGRFCNSNEKLKRFNEEIMTHEATQEGDYILAEINHLPESRLGNVIHRAQSREYQINYSAGFNEQEGKHIPIDDLYIGLRKDKIVLLSKRFQKVVRTYHSNAFNSGMESNLPIFQFLADLEGQHNTAAGSLNLSSFHTYLQFLPRIMYKNIIFQRASWKLTKKDFEPLFKLKDADLIAEFKALRKKWQLPEQFVIKANDNELLIHGNNACSIQILLKEVKKTEQIQLSEFLAASYQSIIKDAKGESYNNEILFNYKMTASAEVNYFNIPSVLRTDIQEIFPPGSEWIYYKIYLGIKTADKFLLEAAATLHQLKNENKIEKWFFIRYGDPQLHVRLRLKLTDIRFLGDVMNRLNTYFKAFQSNYPINRVVMDSYQRELERYGYDLIDVFESIFYEDSKMNIALIEHCNEYDMKDKLWLTTLYSMHTLIDLFELDADQKDSYISWSSNAFRGEFNAYSETTKSLNKKYNTDKKVVFELFVKENYSDFNSFVAHVDYRNRMIRPLVKQILDQNPRFQDRTNFLNSVIHMTVNRQFRSSQRLYEFVLYDFLQKITKTMKFVNPPNKKIPKRNLTE